MESLIVRAHVAEVEALKVLVSLQDIGWKVVVSVAVAVSGFIFDARRNFISCNGFSEITKR